jgi:AcrR family transcriptional regulator
VPGSTRARLLEAGRALFSAHGLEGAQVGAIARAAGVTTGPLYHHFGDKQGLFVVIWREWTRRLADRAAGALAVSPDRVGDAGLMIYEQGMAWGVGLIVAEPCPAGIPDPLEVAFRAGCAMSARPAVPLLVGLLRLAWRQGLESREGLRLVLSGLNTAPTAPGPSE